MRGRLSYDKWAVGHMGNYDYIAERIVDGKHETQYVHSHCLACAKTDILAKYGGKVDLRGWHKSPCGVFLLAMAQTMDEEGQ